MPPRPRPAGAGRSRPCTSTSPVGAELVVDALFGAGLARPLEGAALAVIDALGRRIGPGRGGRRALRPRRRHRCGPRDRAARRAHRDLLPPQAGPSAAARPAPCAGGLCSPTSASRTSRGRRTCRRTARQRPVAVARAAAATDARQPQVPLRPCAGRGRPGGHHGCRAARGRGGAAGRGGSGQRRLPPGLAHDLRRAAHGRDDQARRGCGGAVRTCSPMRATARS